MTIEEFEQIVLGTLLAGDDPMLIALRAQYATAIVTQRNLTGAGLYTHLAIPDETPHVTPADFIIEDVNLDLQGLENGAMAMLFVHDGVIDFLEVYTLTGAWPDRLGSPLNRSTGPRC